MKPALLILCFLWISPLAAFAQAGVLGIHADPAGNTSSCDLVDKAPGLYNIYIVHVNTPGTTASQFKVQWDPCMAMTYLSEAVTAPYIGIGNSMNGMAIAYGACVPSPNMILTYSFFAQGLTPPCCWMRVIADPTTTPPRIYVTDCADPPNLMIARGGSAVINKDDNCPCGG